MDEKWVGRVIELKVKQFRFEGKTGTAIIGAPTK
jgi:hypothetical protein